MSDELDLKDFRFWFDGYAENIKDRPTKEQWARIKEQVARVRQAPLVATAAAMATTGPTAPGKLKAVPGDPATDPRFTPETMPGNDAGPRLAKGSAMSAGPR